MSNSISWLGNKVVDSNLQTNQARNPQVQMDNQNQYQVSNKMQNQYQDPSQMQNQYQYQNQAQLHMPSQTQSQNQIMAQNVPPMMQDADSEMPSTSYMQGPPPINEPGYVPYYLRGNIGKFIRAEFLLGTSQYMDKAGILVEVGINYFVIEDVNLHARIMCDLYSVKFVTTLIMQ